MVKNIPKSPESQSKREQREKNLKSVPFNSNADLRPGEYVDKI